MFQNDAEIDCYHDLILAEYSNLEANAFSFENPNSRLDRFQVTSICSNRGVKQADIQKEGLLIQYPDGTLRTMHLDLIYRAVNARAASWSTKISLEFKLVKPREESIPSFTEHKLDQLASVLNVDSGIARIIVDSLHEAGYQGLAHHQLHYLSKIITRQDKGYLLVAPTASGKSLIFYITALASILSEKSTKGTKALILYPRKALASDQLMKF